MTTPTFFAGAALTGGLIIAVGPQNLHVLRTGLSRRHLGATVALCVAADALLIGSGLAGVSAALLASPAGADAARWVAVPLLGWLAWRAAREATGGTVDAATGPTTSARTLPAALGQASAVTFGNPAVWVETLLIVGAAGAALPAAERAAFGAGALAASCTWFCGLGYGARVAARWLARPALQRALAACSALLLAAMACQLSVRPFDATASEPSARVQTDRGPAAADAARVGARFPTPFTSQGTLS